MKKKEKVYLSGKISGRERADYLKDFEDAETLARSYGYEVCNPTKALPCRFLWIYRLLGYTIVLLYDLWLLSRCDYIYMIDGWESSKGATLELTAAGTFGVRRIILFRSTDKVICGEAIL